MTMYDPENATLEITVDETVADGVDVMIGSGVRAAQGVYSNSYDIGNIWVLGILITLVLGAFAKAKGAGKSVGI